MKFHVLFIIIVSILGWLLLNFAMVVPLWLKLFGAIIGFFGFVFVFLLTDSIGDNMRIFGIDMIVIAVVFALL